MFYARCRLVYNINIKGKKMDDIRIDDDPRKQSAKKIKKNENQKNEKRGVTEFLIDWIVKSLLLTILLAIDFTLFANTGSYSIFTPAGGINMEAVWIYSGIGVTSFVVMLIFMMAFSLDNLLLAAGVGAFVVALINQFGLFDKKSLLLILAGDWFSDDVNVMLYKYSFWIVGALVFLVTYIILKILSRVWLFYITVAVFGLLGWVVSQAYFNTSKPIFYNLKSRVAPLGDNVGSNLVFLSFSNLTSINNLYNFYLRDPQNSFAQKAWQTALGFYGKNNFKVYPNAVVARDYSENDNISSFYNPETDKLNDTSDTLLFDGYFDFKHLHLKNNYLKRNSFIDSLKNKGFSINVYQLDSLNVCNNDKIDNCAEKINYPFIMQADKIPLKDRAIILASQWLVSTGIVKSLNPVLSVVRYLVDGIKPYSFEVNKLNAINSFNALDMIIKDIERKSGNQAYFAVLDVPSDTFMYDEYCSLKGVKDWTDAENLNLLPVSLGTRQKAYLEQSMCLYGYLNKYIQPLENIGMDEYTTIIITGLSTPKFLGDIKENDFYHKLQAEQSVAMAIKSAKAKTYAIYYSACLGRDILDAYFSNNKECPEFGFIKTTDKVIDNMRKSIKDGVIREAAINDSINAFNDWFVDWARLNNYAKTTPDPVIVPNQSASVGEIDIAEIKTTDNAVDENNNSDIPLQKGVVEPENTEDAVSQASEEATEVIPGTLFDEGLSETEKKEEIKKENINQEAAADIKEVEEQEKTLIKLIIRKL